MARSSGFRSKKPYERSAGPRASDGMWPHDLHDKDVPAAVANTKKAPQTGDSSSNTKLIVSNLHYNVTKNDLIVIFGQVGMLTREPSIKYDKSGRSTGVAFVTFETPEDAAKAVETYDGINAKGQPMSVEYDTAAPKRQTREGPPLGDRIAKRSLISRLSDGKSTTLRSQRDTKSKDQIAGDVEVGPIRTRARRNKGRKLGEKYKKEPKTVEDLDKELEAYLKDDGPTTVPPVSATSGEDVEMAI